MGSAVGTRSSNYLVPRAASSLTSGLKWQSANSAKIRDESEFLGVSVGYLQGHFIAEVEEAFGAGADPDFYKVNQRLLCGPEGRGHGRRCPRDGQPHCSYVDAIDGQYTGRATVMLSYAWQYSVRTVVDTLVRWCRNNELDVEKVFVWQCALCCNQYRAQSRTEKPDGQQQSFEAFKELFERRVSCIGHVIALVAPWSNPVYIDRMWCLMEFHTAMCVDNCRLDIVVADKDEKSFRSALEDPGTLLQSQVWKAFEELRFQSAKVESSLDRDYLLRLADPSATDYDSSLNCNALNADVSRRLQQWLAQQAAKSVSSLLRTGISGAAALRPCHDAISLLQVVGEWHKADELFDAGVHLAKSAGMTASPSYAALLHIQARCLSIQGRETDAVALFEEAKLVFQAAGSTNTANYAALLQSLGVCLEKQGRFEEEIAVYEEAKAAYAAADAMKSQSYASLLMSMGACFGEQGRLGDEVKCYKEAKDTFIVAGLTESITYAELLQNIGVCLGEIGHCAEEVTLYREAREVYVSLDATRSPSYVTLLQRMGRALCKEGWNFEAVHVYKEARAAYVSAGATRTPGYAKLLQSMGACLNNQGRQAEALDFYQEGKALYVEAGATQSAAYGSLLSGMGACLGKLGRTEEQQQAFEESKAAFVAAGATGSPSYASLIRRMNPVPSRESLASQPCPDERVDQEAMPRHSAASEVVLGQSEINALLVNSRKPSAQSSRKTSAQSSRAESLAQSSNSGATGGSNEVTEREARVPSPPPPVQSPTAKADLSLAERNANYAFLLQTRAEALHNQGRANEALGIYKDAKAAYLAAGATKRPGYASLLHRMGNCLGDQGRSAEADMAYQEAKVAYIGASAFGTPSYTSLVRSMSRIEVT